MDSIALCICNSRYNSLITCYNQGCVFYITLLFECCMSPKIQLQHIVSYTKKTSCTKDDMMLITQYAKLSNLKLYCHNAMAWSAQLSPTRLSHLSRYVEYDLNCGFVYIQSGTGLTWRYFKVIWLNWCKILQTLLFQFKSDICQFRLSGIGTNLN